MGSLSDYAEKKVLELLVGKTAFSTPVCYVALSTADPLDDGSGLVEPGSNYARVATAGADWEAATLGAGTIQNANPITFVEATGSWGTPSHFALFDASSNLLGHGSITTPKAVGAGDTLRFAAGDIDLSLA